MHKLVLSGAMAAGMMIGMSGAASAADMMMMSMNDYDAYGACQERTPWSDAACECVAERADEQLTYGQIALLLSVGDGEINWLSTAREYDVSLGERMEVRGFVRFTAPACVLMYPTD